MITKKETPEFFIKHCPNGIHDRVANDGVSPVYYMIIHMKGMFPGRILANPFGGNCYYQTIEEAEKARDELIRKRSANEQI